MISEEKPSPRPRWDAETTDRAAVVRALYGVRCPQHHAAVGRPCWPWYWPDTDNRPPVCQVRATLALAALGVVAKAGEDATLTVAAAHEVDG